MAKEFNKKEFKNLRIRIACAFIVIGLIGIASVICGATIGKGFDAYKPAEPENIDPKDYYGEYYAGNEDYLYIIEIDEYAFTRSIVSGRETVEDEYNYEYSSVEHAYVTYKIESEAGIIRFYDPQSPSNVKYVLLAKDDADEYIIIDKGNNITYTTEELEAPSKIKDSVKSTISWTNVSDYLGDHWNFYSPYIKDDVLYIECYDVSFGADLEWVAAEGKDYAVGLVSLDDTFEEYGAFKIDYEKAAVQSSEWNDFKISVPLSTLNVTEPTKLYFAAQVLVNGQESVLYFNISIEW